LINISGGKCRLFKIKYKLNTKSIKYIDVSIARKTVSAVSGLIINAIRNEDIAPPNSKICHDSKVFKADLL
jgi:hypothetical protein